MAAENPGPSAATEDEPIWLKQGLKNMCSFVEGYWTEVEKTKDRLVKLKQFEEEDANATSDLKAQIATAITDWQESIAKVRTHIGQTSMELSVFFPDISMDEQYKCPIDFVGISNNVAAIMLDAEDLRRILEEFKKMYGAIKEVLLDNSRMIEFLDDEDVDHYEAKKLLWTDTSKELIRYMSSELIRMQNFQKDSVHPIEKSISGDEDDE